MSNKSFLGHLDSVDRISKPKQKSKSKRCKCGAKNVSQSCASCSQYKIVFLLKIRSSHLKITVASGKKVCPVWWSFIKEEKKPLKDIFNSMLERAKKEAPELYNGSNVIQFYHRNGSQPIDSHFP